MGLTGAVILHAFWNGSAVFGDFFQLYITLQIPLFVIFILGVLALRREEARLTRNRLGRLRRRWMVHAPGGRDAGDPRRSANGACLGEDPDGRPQRPP